jgi:GNAT superfamily N-acetyltransferase
MKDKLTYEKISDENFNDFIFLVEKLAEYEKLKPPSIDGKENLRRDGLSENPKYEAYIWKLNEKAIGYIFYFFTYSSFVTLPTLYIEDIFILKEYRGKGFGKNMFQFCIDIAKEHGCGRIEWCVLTWNKPAIKFYEKYNAKQLSDWFYYRLDKDQIEKLSNKK